MGSGRGEILRRALKLYHEIPYQYTADSPTIRYYTDWAAFDRQRPAASRYPCEDSGEEADVVISGGCVKILRSPKGVRVKHVMREDLESLSPEDPLLRLVKLDDSKVYALHVAGLSVAAEIFIESDVEDPLKILVVGGSAEGHLAQHVGMVVSEGVSARVEVVVDSSEKALRTLVEEIELMPGSRLEIATIARGARSPLFYAKHYKLADGSEVISGMSNVAGPMSRIQQRALLEGRGARHTALGAAIAAGENRVHYIENAVVRGRDSRAVLNVRGIAADLARTVVQGFAIQEEESFGSGTNVEVSTLSIGRGAMAVTLPMLEVRCGDVVEARHAASQAVLDADIMTYLRSRGLRVHEAVKLMVYDYIVEPFQDLPQWMVENLVSNIYGEADKIDFEALKLL